MLRQIPKYTDPRILVGTADFDDSAVYCPIEGLAVVQSTDIFTPVVDSPRDFGRIAAANALSDLYAMGCDPAFALSIVTFPRSLSFSILEEILAGGLDICAEAGIPLLGGHSIVDNEPKFGLVATGFMAPADVIRNAGARPGDKLVLTKPLGVGIMTTAIKRGCISDSELRAVTTSMVTLNRGACHAMRRIGVHAATDVTGYGLLGHLSEMLSASAVGCRLELDQIPLLEGAAVHLANGLCPGGTKRNLQSVDKRLSAASHVTEEQLLLLADAQTSGGLLIAVAPEKAASLVAELAKENTGASSIIGEILGGEIQIEVV